VTPELFAKGQVNGQCDINGANSGAFHQY